MSILQRNQYAVYILCDLWFEMKELYAFLDENVIKKQFVA